MQEVDMYQIDNAEIKREKYGLLIIGFYSQKITDNQLTSLLDIKEEYFLAFYSCDFSLCELEILVRTGTKKIGIFHSLFGDNELKVLSCSPTLELITLHDTKVTDSCIAEVSKKNPNLNFTIVNK
jgi:hypothetical protein